jgi:RhtB (resistance to homoserine/threonine) family protein
VLDQLLVIISVTALVMVSPGPDMILVMRNTLVGGRGAGLQTSAGILSGNIVHITYCVFGLGLIIAQSILAYATLKYAGAAYLIYLGVRSFRAGCRPLDTNETENRTPSSTWFVQGVANNLLNPKGALFYFGVFTVVITPQTSAGTMLVLVLTMMLVSASFWLLFVHTLDRPIIRGSLERSQHHVSKILGFLLVFLGIRVAAMSR